jgi:CheY-like chemotaxis protein
MHVLVVEDDARVAETISDLLSEAEGVPIEPVSTTSEARRLIKPPSLSATLLDVNLGMGRSPPAGGTECARHPDLVALAQPVLPARLIGELRKVIGASGPRSLGH